MKITLKPSEIIDRFIWDKFEFYILEGKTRNQINKIIEEDKEFEISEEDAFVIGLTNVIYTNELNYKLKQFLKETLENKKMKNKEDKIIYVSKEQMIDAISLFKRKIPTDYKNADIIFNKQLKELPKLYDKFINNLNKLKITSIKNIDHLYVVQVKKVINRI